MRTISYTDKADADIQNAVSYLAQHSPQAIEKLIEQIDQRTQLLANQPGIGRPRDDLGQGVRSSKVGRHLLFYRYNDANLVVLRFIHGSRNIEQVFQAE